MSPVLTRANTGQGGWIWAHLWLVQANERGKRKREREKFEDQSTNFLCPDDGEAGLIGRTLRAIVTTVFFFFPFLPANSAASPFALGWAKVSSFLRMRIEREREREGQRCEKSDTLGPHVSFTWPVSQWFSLVVFLVPGVVFELALHNSSVIDAWLTLGLNWWACGLWRRRDRTE